jgi:hypothetical protein
MTAPRKFCVFCGQHPQGKSREHIIPQWLLELTGDPNRKAFFGFDFTKKEPGIRHYSFDSFVFPSCEQCNQEFSKLEANAKQILTALLADGSLDSTDWDTLLDWLDKIRVGLWLGFFYLNKNPVGVHPKFYIKTRIGTRDRFTIVYKADTNRKGINFIGAESLSFQNMPSCFTLSVNNYMFFNASNFSLVDRRLGFPFPKSASHSPDGSRILYDIAEGFERTRYPVVRKQFPSGGSFLCQAIFKGQMQTPEMSALYEFDYVTSNSLEWDAGRGSIFQELNCKVAKYPPEKTKQWIPPQSLPLFDLIKALTNKTLDYQVDLFVGCASTEDLSDEVRKQYKYDLIAMRSFNKLLKYIADEQLKKRYA